MITKALLAGLAALAAAPALAATPPADIYRLAPVVEDGKIMALSITLTLPADADGQTVLKLPDAWGGGDKLWRFLKDPVVTGGTLSTPDEKTWRITSKPRAPLTIRYRIVSAYDGDPPLDSPAFGQPIVWSDGFYVIGHTIFAWPEGRRGDVARFAWDPAGSGLRLASNLERFQKTAGRVNDLPHSVLLASKDLTVITRDVAGAPIRVAVRGAFGFSDQAFADVAAQSIGAVRAFWGERGEPFLITLAPLSGPPGASLNRGNALDGAFAAISTRSRPIGDYRLFLTHEYFHTWNPPRLGGAKAGPDEPLGYWFSEGFTDYYARRLALRSGQIDLEAFAAAWNGVLAAYGTSPVRTAPNTEIAARFWREASVQKLPYYRGALIALMMETRLKGQGGLDPVMRAMRDHTKDSPRPDSAAALFPRIVQARTSLDVTPDLERWATRGEAITLPADAFGGCLSVETVRRRIYSLGFDSAASGAAQVIAGVDPAGPAYAAGLRDGMVYLGRKGGQAGDASVEVTQVVRDGGTARMITYLPQGRGEVDVQRVIAPTDLTPQARAACVKAVAG